MLTVLLGLAYPLAMTGFAQVVFPGKADGSLVDRDGRVVGSVGSVRSIGQSVSTPTATRSRPTYFQSRPSAAGDGYDPLAVVGLQPRPGERGPGRGDRGAPRRGGRARRHRPRRCRPRRAAGQRLRTRPAHQPAYAEQQVARVARERGLATTGCASSWTSTPTAATLGFLGEPRVNVLDAQPCARRASAGRGRLGSSGLRRGQAAGSTSARRPGSARPTPCSARDTVAPSAAPTSSSGFVETHGRRHTAELVDGLEVVPRRTSPTAARPSPRWTSTPCSRRRPKVALVDELAHTNVPGSRNAKRWQDIEELLDAGIDVITTVNIQHLESVNDVVEKITGVPQRETVPDAVVRAADQIELVDMAAEALRRRLAHGNVYAPEKVDAALGNYFRLGQPQRAARAGAAVDRRPGRRRPAARTASSTTSPAPGRRASGSSSRSPAGPRARP